MEEIIQQSQSTELALIQQPQFLEIINNSEISKDLTDAIASKFNQYAPALFSIENEAYAIVVKDAIDVSTMKLAKTKRLELKQQRIAIEKLRKELKDDYLKTGRVIDSISKLLSEPIERAEEYLEKQEKYAEIAEAKRKDEQKTARLETLTPYMAFVPESSIHYLGDMSDKDFEILVNGSKLQHESKVAADEKAKKDADEKVKKDELYNKRMNEITQKELWNHFDKTYDGYWGHFTDEYFQEIMVAAQANKEKADARKKELEELNTKLQKEKEEADKRADALRLETEKKVASEKAANDAKLKVANDARIKAENEAALRKVEDDKKLKAANDAKAALEKELADKKAADEKAKGDAEAQVLLAAKLKANADKKARLAPDRTKLLAFAEAINALERPEVKSDEAKAILNTVNESINKFVKYIKVNSEAL